MWIQHLDPAKLADAYGIKCQGLYPWDGLARTPFGAAWAVVEPGRSTKRHMHNDGETFIIAQGSGVMAVGGERADVKAGDVIYLPPFEEHTLSNTSAEDLVFLTVWWEDLALWTSRNRSAGTGVTANPCAAALVTAAPPTPNGDLHLGHLSGPYLAADMHSRYLRLRGVATRYACGTDDNQSYVALKAAQMGLGPAEAADRLAADIASTLRAARIEMDLFVRPNASPCHLDLVQGFFRRLYDEGRLVAREAPSPFCEPCGRYLFEAHIRGNCPHCGAASGGNSCEECGLPNDCIDLVAPACTRCGAKPAARRFKRLYFPLGNHAQALRDFHETVAMGPHLRALCERALAAGLRDIAVTHPADWGIPVPVPGFEDQRIYVWFEMAPRYLAYGQALGGWPRFWKAGDARVVQCFGFDNGFFYAILVPALLRAYDPEIRLASAFLVNEFYHLEGTKFSTSRGHAIWGRELLAEWPADAVRFHLSATSPEVESTSFALADFRATVERELIGAIQGWLAGLGAKVAVELGGAAPSPGDWTEEQRRFHRSLEELVAEAGGAYEAATFSPQRAARAIATLAREGRRFGKAEDHLGRAPFRGEERRTALALELLAAKALAVIAAPVMPDFAERLFKDLGYEGLPWSNGWEERPAWVPPGQRIGRLAGPYFSPRGGAA
jgi:methionyl-tRNA synthetase